MTHDIIATRIIAMLHQAESHLIGRTVVTFSGETGTVCAIKLDDHHGLCFTFDPDPYKVFRGGRPSVRWYPVSTIRMKS